MGGAPSNQPYIGIVTVTYNSGDVVDEFIQSIRAQSWTNFRLYVVDNASRDDSLERLRTGFAGDSRYREIANANNCGIARGNNQGTSAALADGCDYVLLLNNDTVFAPDLLAGMVAEMERLGARALVPKMLYHEPSNVIWCAGGTFNPWRGYSVIHYGENEVDRGDYDQPRRIEYAPTCCMLIKKDVFSEIGLMDENYFVYMDDVDFCFRALKAGIELWYSPQTTLYHKVGSLTGGMSDFSVLNATRGKVYFIRKHAGWAIAGWLLIYQVLFLTRIFSPTYGWRRFLLLERAFREGCALKLGPERT